MKKNKSPAIKSIVLSLALVGLISISVFAAEKIPRINKEDLKELLGSPDVILLDVRRTENWQESESKIKGAIRRRPQNFDTWANEFPRDKKIVLY